ncbi:DUF1801 domain-containing protein [bacterium]|nr:DUF1801 domain-containing protein [bacterium]
MLQFEKDIASPYSAMLAQARNMLICDYKLTETRKPRITTYSDEHGGICHMRTMPDGLDIGFLKGAKMHDPNNLLSGRGKLLRVLSFQKFDAQVAQEFLDQAIAINAGR